MLANIEFRKIKEKPYGHFIGTINKWEQTYHPKSLLKDNYNSLYCTITWQNNSKYFTQRAIIIPGNEESSLNWKENKFLFRLFNYFS
jgi:hypothetical protein